MNPKSATLAQCALRFKSSTIPSLYKIEID